MSAASRKAKGVFRSHDSARSEQLWEIEIPMRKVIAQSADRRTLAEGRELQLSPESTSEVRTGSGIRNDVAGIMWSAFKADVGDTIVMDLQYRLH